MAKDSKNSITSPTPYESPTTIKVTKAQAGQVAVGDVVSITVKGEVVGLHQGYDDKDQYEIQLKKVKVSEIEQSNAADKEYKKLTGK